MRKGFLLMVLSLVVSTTIALGQTDYQRKAVTVPKVDPAAITIDGAMDEPAWATGGKADMITSAGFEIFTNKYYRETLTEPDYDEMYARLLWAKDTLYVFMHIDEFVDDSTDLFWDGQWTGDQLFISLSNRLGVNMKGWYDGNVYAAPDGPYHFLILGDQVTLNNGSETGIPDEYKKFPDDTTRVFDAATIARWATFIDKTNGVWNVEMAIYQPNADAGAKVGFNIGGSTGSTYSDTAYGDAYAYYTWQPSVIDSPYAQPQGVPIPEWGADPGYYNLAFDGAWALLELEPGVDDYARKMVTVPKVDPAAITIDGTMDEPAWATGGKADMITSAGFEIFTNKYYRESLTEPDYDEMYARMLWARDTLYVFMHIDEFVDDSTDLFWDGQWTGDQLFIGLSSRLGVNMKGWYDGNVYASPDGPYHFLILGDQVTLNNGSETGIPDEFKGFPDDTTRVFDAATIARWATFIDKTNGVWNVEMAIYQPNVDFGSRIGFNIGGSTGSTYSDTAYGDAYAYYTWKPSVIDSPYAQPQGVPIPEWGADPGYYTLAFDGAWSLLEFGPEGTSGVDNPDAEGRMPNSFVLNQNYPNPFNPSTRVSFDVPRAAKVTLTVYNLLGQKVATLVNERLSAGRHEMTWNAQNLPSGMYIMHMQADGSFTSSRKMMLLK